MILARIHHETLIYRPTLAVRTLDNGVTLARIAAEGCDPLYWVMRWAERNKVVVVNVAYRLRDRRPILVF
jgi:hypothetical protein